MAGELLEIQDMNPASLVEDTLNISFENINYTVRQGMFLEERKTILNDVCGTFFAGELTVVMGQSGSGKSTLMDVLSGFTTPTSGCLWINGRIRDPKVFQRRSCYVLQDDRVQEMLTIQESLNLSANLKLGHHVSLEQKNRRVQEIITSLGLNRVRHTKAANLSGGQRKRLAIGLELINDPPVMFLDEPTSGLDSSISKQIVYLLHLLARQGRTVVATMHQPSGALLNMVDRLYAIVGGRCAYIGSVPQLLPYLAQMDLMCPPYHNPVDFLIEICADNANMLVEKAKNGKNLEWTTKICLLNDSNIRERFNLGEEVTLSLLPTPKDNPTSKILLALKSTHSTSSWKQFTTLLQRSILSMWREPSFTLMIVGIHLVIGLFIGVLFYNTGSDAKYVRDVYNFLNFSLMFNMFTAFNSITITFPEQIPVIRREHFNRWYTAGPYYLATLISTLPRQTICTCIYAFITYWLTAQPPEFKRFVLFCFVLLTVNYVALCKGLLIGALFNVKHAVVFGPFFIMPFFLLSGFFLRYGDAPYYLQWLFQTSFLKHGLVGLLLAIFGMDRPNLACSETYCHYVYPSQFLKDSGVEGETYTFLLVALIFIGSVAYVLGFIILKIRLKSKW